MKFLFSLFLFHSCQLSTNPMPQEIFNPLFLNGTLTKAISSSIFSDDKLMQNLSFALTHMPNVLMPNAPNSLSCLELRYIVKWPLNVILTRECMKKYCKIFTFLLQVGVLIFGRLKWGSGLTFRKRGISFAYQCYMIFSRSNLLKFFVNH